jgi:hypothetical protein
MGPLDQKVQVHPEVVDTALDTGEIVLLHLESATYYSLNVTGARIWQGMQQGLTLQAISHRLQTEFAVDAARADRSVLRLLEELTHQRLVQMADG